MQHFLQRQRRWLYLLNLFTYAARVWRLTMLDACGLPPLQQGVCVCEKVQISALPSSKHSALHSTIEGIKGSLCTFSTYPRAEQVQCKHLPGDNKHTHIEEQASIHSHILAHSGTSTVCRAQCAENAAPLVLISRGTNDAENGNGSEWRCASFIYSWNRSTAHYNPCELRISLIKHTSRLHVMCARRGISSAQFDQGYLFLSMNGKRCRER